MEEKQDALVSTGAQRMLNSMANVGVGYIRGLGMGYGVCTNSRKPARAAIESTRDCNAAALVGDIAPVVHGAGTASIAQGSGTSGSASAVQGAGTSGEMAKKVLTQQKSTLALCCLWRIPPVWAQVMQMKMVRSYQVVEVVMLVYVMVRFSVYGQQRFFYYSWCFP